MANGRRATQSLLQLTYVSLAVDLSEPTRLAALLRSCEFNNGRLGLTGLLLHRDGRFYSVIEGPERALLARMEIIATDQRHRAVKVLSERPIGMRRFRNWSFAMLPAAGPGPGPGRAERALLAMLSGRLPHDRPR